MVNEKRTIDRHSTARVLIIVALVTVVVSVAVFLLETHVESKRAQIEIQKRLEAIRAAGQPLTAQDLAKLYPDPLPEHDAAILLNPAFSTLVFPEDSTNLPIVSVDLPAHFTPLDEATVAEMRRWLDTNQTAFASVPWDQITNAWFGSGFAAGFPNLTTVPTKLIRLARMECLEAIDRAEAGDGASATTALLHGLALRKTLPSDTLLKHLIGRTVEQMICAALERTINRTRLSLDDLLPLGKALADDNAKNLNDVFVNLRCELIWEMELVRKNPWAALMFDNTWKGKTVSWFNVASGKAYRDSDFELMLDRYGQRLEVMQFPLKQRLNELGRLDLEAKKEKQNGTIALVLIDDGGNYSNLANRDAQVVAHLRTAKAAIALERWRLTNAGSLPDSLAELVPDFLPTIPTDPFDEQPLHYKKLAHGYVVYSIGPDFTDDGGKQKPADAKESDHYDITFTVER